MNNTIYSKLKIKIMINAAGTYTLVGGSKMSEQTINDMCEAACYYVNIKDLQCAANEKLARLTKNEAACICNGAAAGLYIATAACVEMHSNRSIDKLSVNEITKKEIILFKSQRNPYDLSIRQLGVKIVEVDNKNRNSCLKNLESSTNENTAGIFFMYMEEGGWIDPGEIELTTVIEHAKKYNIPLIVDAAAQLPPVDNLWKINELGATATLFSGGKDIRGPQSSGFIVGQKEFTNVFNKINFMNYGYGRMLKVGREEIIGLLSAVEQYTRMDHTKRNNWVEEQIVLLINYSKTSKLFKIIRSYPNEAAQPLARAEVILRTNRITLEQLSTILVSSEPSVYTFVDNGRLFINPMTLLEGETQIIIKQLQQIENKYIQSSINP